MSGWIVALMVAVALLAAFVAARMALAAYRAHEAREREKRARSLAQRLATGRP